MQYKAKSPKRLFCGLFIFPLFLACLPNLMGMDPHKNITQYIKRNWSLDQGLPQASVQTILQTSDNYLWLGTQEGLVRFDGVKFRVFNNAGPTRIHNISALWEDSKDVLWVGTSRTIVSYRDGVFTTYEHLENAPTGRVTCITETEPGTLWIGTDYGLFRLQNDTFFRYTTVNGLPDNLIEALLADRNGSLWVGTGNGLIIMEGDDLIELGEDQGLPGNHVKELLQTRDGAVWIGGEKGLTRYFEGRMRHFTEESGLTNHFIDSLYEDRDGILWIGTMSGLSRWHNGVLMAEGLEPRDQILAITEDTEGNLWVGAWTDGLYQFRDGAATCFGVPEGFPDDGTRGIVKDKHGAYWVGTRAGVLRMKDGEIELFDQSRGLAGNTPYTLMADDEGIWVGDRYAGLSYIQEGQITVLTTENGLTDNSIRTLVPNGEGGMWVGTYGGGVDLYRNGRFQRLSSDDKISSSLVYAVMEDRDKRLWVGTAGQGLNVVRDGKVNAFNIEDGLAGNTVVSFYQDEYGDIWIGTTDGLSRYRDGRFSNVSAKDGLFDDLIYNITEDSNGVFWMSCNKAVHTVRKSVVNDFLDGRISQVNGRGFGVSDGMRSPEINFAGLSTALVDDDAIWFATSKGLARFNPLKIKDTRTPPPIIIEEVRSDPPALSTGPVPEYLTGGRSFEIHYTALSFGEPQKVRFRHKIEGYDKSWRYVDKRREAYYGSIPPGDYTFRVVAENENGGAAGEGASFKFKVLPRYYQTWWFFLLIGCAVTFLAWCVFRLRIRQMVSREHKLQSLVNKRTRALEVANANLVKTQEELVKAAHQAGMADVATNVLHEIGNALNSVNVNSSIIEKDVRGLKTDFLARLVELINENRDNLSEFLSNDQRGRQVAPALNKISETLGKSKGKLLDRIKTLDTQILRLNDIIRAQKSHAQMAGAFYESLDINRFLNQILDAKAAEAIERSIVVERRYDPIPEFQVQKAKLKQIMIHLLTNAFEAVDNEYIQKPRIHVVTRLLPEGFVQIQIIDNGVGMDDQAMERIYFHGYTTKHGRDGFGLHYCANAAREMNGRLQGANNSPDPGTTFSLDLPFDPKHKTLEEPKVSIKDSP